MCQNIENGDLYEDVLASFKDQFDKPRDMHRIYLNNQLKIGPVKPTKSSLMACATTIKSSRDGLIRLKQMDVHSIFTTIAEEFLPEKVKNRWEELTVDSKTVPPVGDLIAFIRQRAAMPQYADKTPASTPSSERKPFKQQPPRHKGSVHVAASQPTQTPSQQPEQPSPKPSVNGRVQSNKSKGQPFPPCRYTCPGCSEAHYAREKSVAQRKEYVRTQSLCSNCLKPGHSQADCRSRYSCQLCEGSHNTLLHTPEQGSSNPPPASGTVNFTSSNSSTNSFHHNELMMTCEALATGPTGKSMPVRALLDSLADVSSVTTQVANHLNLKHLDATVAVSTFGSLNEKVCQAANFTLSSFHKKDWSLQVSAVIIDKITDDHPKQDASLVREMTAVKGLTPADSQFHKPGRIDVLLGADVLPYIQTTSGPKAPSLQWRPCLAMPSWEPTSLLILVHQSRPLSKW